MKKIVYFSQSKETKGAIQYKETDKSGAEIEFKESTVGSLYLRKSAVKNIPKKLTVTIEG